jgi:hypothetical protein
MATLGTGKLVSSPLEVRREQAPTPTIQRVMTAVVGSLSFAEFQTSGFGGPIMPEGFLTNTDVLTDPTPALDRS